MDYPLALLCYVFALFLGGAFGTLVCIIGAKLTKRKFYKFRTSLFLVLLSFLGLLVAFFLIKLRYISVFLIFLKNKISWITFYFVIGALCTIFIKIALPIFVLCFALFSIATGVRLYKDFDLRNENFSVIVNEHVIKIQDKEFEILVNDKNQNENALCSINFAVWTLPDELIFPLPRTWYKVINVTNVNEPEKGGAQEKSALPYTQEITNLKMSLLDNKKNKNFFGTLFNYYYKHIIKDCIVENVVIQQQTVYPSMFSLKIKSTPENFSFDLVRLM